MRDVLVLITLPLAAYYVTWLFVHAKISVGVVERWQGFWEDHWIRRHAKNDPQLEAEMWASGEWHSKLAYLPTCAWCTGFWVSLGFVNAVLPSTDVAVWPFWPLYLLAVSAFIGLVDTWTHRKA
jgi:hypothetical protein